ncbi:HAD-IA family hydrolase [Paenibacillus sp. R14(2021)]|uniref:HAD-IA family hydrolase n=1 Tax=Paenibacillus sp. R14(2021) TaxID=2859228 RepID=UPI001C616517|nr:HAD-IA family hydrolase [Paenibacillus sp. R14(2021)]
MNSNSPIKHMIFDFDGTIVDSRGLMIDLYNELAVTHNYKIIAAEEVNGLSKLSIPERCHALGVPLYRVPLLAKQAKSRYQEKIESLKANPGMRELVLQLKENGYELSVISSNTTSNIEAFLNRNDMNEYAHVTTASNLFGKHRAINAFLRKHRISPEHACYVGDELRDIEACRKSNIRIISVAWGYDSAELLRQGEPDYLAWKPIEIMRYLQKAH